MLLLGLKPQKALLKNFGPSSQLTADSSHEHKHPPASSPLRRPLGPISANRHTTSSPKRPTLVSSAAAASNRPNHKSMLLVLSTHLLPKTPQHCLHSPHETQQRLSSAPYLCRRSAIPTPASTGAGNSSLPAASISRQIANSNIPPAIRSAVADAPPLWPSTSSSVNQHPGLKICGERKEFNHWSNGE